MYWSWILGAVGLVGLYLSGLKLWWSWYINLGAQGLWLAYSITTEQYGFLVATFGYIYVFGTNAVRWTRDHSEAVKSKQLEAEVEVKYEKVGEIDSHEPKRILDGADFMTRIYHDNGEPEHVLLSTLMKHWKESHAASNG